MSSTYEDLVVPTVAVEPTDAEAERPRRAHRADQAEVTTPAPAEDSSRPPRPASWRSRPATPISS